MVLERKWGYPNKNTFDILPIRDLLMQEIGEDEFWVDPYANKNKFATVTNDLNPECSTDYNLDALEFLKLFDDSSVDGVLFDPPYSPRQVSECYKQFGYEVTGEMTRSTFWMKQKKEIERIVKPGGKVISFAWNSGGGRTEVRIPDRKNSVGSPWWLAQ